MDLMTIKPYLSIKNLLIFSGVALIMIFSTQMGATAIGILMAYAAMFGSYPFIFAERNKLDVLYATLSLQRSTVVLGRYCFALFLDVAAAFFAYLATFAIMTVLQMPFDPVESILVVLVLLLVYSLLQAIQLPIYFKLGYSKAKLLAYLPLIGLPFALMAFNNLMTVYLSSDSLTSALLWLNENPLLVALIIMVVWALVMLVSYRMSLLFYSKREF
jgi:hypothetical protein